RVEVFSKISAISLPSSRLPSVPAYLAILSASDSLSRKRSSAGSKSISLRKLRLRRLYAMREPSQGSERGVAFDRAGHAVATAAALAELEARNGDHFDTGLAQGGIGAGVAFVGDDHAGLERDHVVAVVPLLPLGLEGVPAGLYDPHSVHAQRLGHQLRHRLVQFLAHRLLG